MNPRDILSALLILLTPMPALADGFDWGDDCSDGNGSFPSTLPKKPSFESAKSLQVSETSMSSFVVQPMWMYSWLT